VVVKRNREEERNDGAREEMEEGGLGFGRRGSALREEKKEVRLRGVDSDWRGKHTRVSCSLSRRGRRQRRKGRTPSSRWAGQERKEGEWADGWWAAPEKQRGGLRGRG
jgi:hypothetical protein